MNEAEKLERLEERATRAQALDSLSKHPGWEVLMGMLDEAQEIYDRQVLAQLRVGTLTEREVHRYEDTTRAYKLFRQQPARAAKALETTLRKMQSAQPDEGDT